VGSATTGGSALTTAGGETVYVAGSNMGPLGTGGSDVVVEYGSGLIGGPVYTATGCVVDAAHSRVQCVSAVGVGYGHVWRVTVGGVVGVWSTVTTSYTAAVVSSFPSASAGGLRTAGGESVQLAGSNFGPTSATLRVVYRNAVYGVEYLASSCVVTGPSAAVWQASGAVCSGVWRWEDRTGRGRCRL
jgi:hypothetical protein